MPVLYTPHFVQFFDNNGDPLAGGKLYSYDAGTDTPKATYTTAAGNVANANPLILDSYGRATLFLSGSYKFSLYDSSNNLIKTTDNVTSFTESGEIPSESIATEAEAEAGVNNTKIITPLRSAQAIAALGGMFNDFRLTLTSGLPVTTSDVTAASTIYLTPYIGNKISLFSGSIWQTVISAEVSLALSGLTSGKPYDIFAYNNSGVVTLELLVWTDDASRATVLARQDGILVKSGDATRRYLGTLYTTGATTTEDSLKKRYLWNYYNRALRKLFATDSTATWTYTTATLRQANNAAANKIEFVIGVAEDMVRASVMATATNGSAVQVYSAIGLNATNASSSTIFPTIVAPAAGHAVAPSAYSGYLAGKNYLAWLEYSTATGTTTWQGNGRCGISGEIFA